jgi:hypothetical protein
MQWTLSAGLSICMLIGSSPALSATVVVSEATIPVEVLQALLTGYSALPGGILERG